MFKDLAKSAGIWVLIGAIGTGIYCGGKSMYDFANMDEQQTAEYNQTFYRIVSANDPDGKPKFMVQTWILTWDNLDVTSGLTVPAFQAPPPHTIYSSKEEAQANLEWYLEKKRKEHAKRWATRANWKPVE